MKKILILAFSITNCSAIFAASITFNQNSGIDYAFQAKGAAIKGLDPYTFTNIAENTYDINNVAQGPQNTTISIGAYSAPNIPAYAPGSIAWSSQQSGNNYHFDISAGGNPGQWDPKGYCLQVFVDNQNLGTNCTSKTTYWAPLSLDNIEFTTNSKIVVNISPLP